MRFIAELKSAFSRGESGATSIEYAIIAGSLSIVILVAVNGIGRNLNAVFVAVHDAFK
ncbi:MAG: Flp/Fap pilin component [Nitrobacter sp.]|uniref:Flp family type IVb pilin n=1 Tax=Nitrobacter sp. TaxID=29420 RepID=UPI00387DF1A3